MKNTTLKYKHLQGIKVENKKGVDIRKAIRFQIIFFVISCFIKLLTEEIFRNQSRVGQWSVSFKIYKQQIMVCFKLYGLILLSNVIFS